MGPARSSGNRSAIQTTRLRRSPSAKTCSEALWCEGRPAHHRPHEPAGLVVDVDDELAGHQTVAERDDPRALLEARVDHEARRQARVHRPHVADRIPDVFASGLDAISRRMDAMICLLSEPRPRTRRFVKVFLRTGIDL